MQSGPKPSDQVSSSQPDENLHEAECQSHIHHARELTASKEYAKAIDAYSTAIQNQSVSRIALAERGELHLKLGNYESAITDFHQCFLLFKDWFYMEREADAQFRRFLATNDIIFLKNAIVNIPIVFSTLSPNASKLFLKILSFVSSSDYKPEHGVFDFVTQAQLFQAIKRLPTSRDVCKYLRESLDPKTLLGARMHGHVNSVTGVKITEEIKQFLVANKRVEEMDRLRKVKSDLECHEKNLQYLTCAQICMEQKEYEAAIDYCNQALKTWPHVQKMWEVRAACYVQTAQFVKAIADYEKANNFSTTSSNYLRMAEIHLKLLDLDAAALDFVAAINESPVDEAAPKAFMEFLTSHANKAVFDLVKRRDLFAAIKKLPNRIYVFKYLYQCLDPKTELGERMRRSENPLALISFKIVLKEIHGYLLEHDPALQQRFISVQPFSTEGPLFFSSKPSAATPRSNMADESDKFYKL